MHLKKYEPNVTLELSNVCKYNVCKWTAKNIFKHKAALKRFTRSEDLCSRR